MPSILDGGRESLGKWQKSTSEEREKVISALEGKAWELSYSTRTRTFPGERFLLDPAVKRGIKGGNGARHNRSCVRNRK